MFARKQEVIQANALTIQLSPHNGVLASGVASQMPAQIDSMRKTK